MAQSILPIGMRLFLGFKCVIISTFGQTLASLHHCVPPGGFMFRKADVYSLLPSTKINTVQYVDSPVNMRNHVFPLVKVLLSV